MRERGPGVARAATLLTVLTGLSQLLGLVRDALIAAVFGARSATDAYLYAQGVLNLVMAAFAIPAVRAMVPPLARAASADDQDRSNRMLHSIVTLTLVATVAASLLAYAGAELIVAVLAPGFDPATAATAARLTRILLAAGVFVALTDLCAAAAQAHGRFVWSGLQGVAFNVVMITVIVAMAARWGIDTLAIGFLAGSLARFVLQLPALRAAGLRLRPRWHLRDDDVREVTALMPALMITTAVTNVNTLVDRAVGSLQGEGVITALSYGWRVVTLVDALLVVTLAAAIYPALSSRSVDPDQLRALVSRALRMMVLILAPVVVMLVVSPEPIVDVLFGRGQFDDEAVRRTAVAMAWYAVSALGLAIRVVLTRTLLALGNRRVTVVASLITLVVNVAGDLTLGLIYGIPGLAASTSVSMLLGVAWLAVMLWRRHRALPVGDMLPGLATTAAAAGIAAVAVLALRLVPAPDLAIPAAWADVLRLAVNGTVLVLSYLLGLVLLRSRDLRELLRLFRR